VRVRLSSVEPAGPVRFSLKCRIPDWAEMPELSVAGDSNVYRPVPGEHAVVRRLWRTGDEVELRFQIRERFVSMADGSVAVARGAQVLAADLRDNPGLPLDALRRPPSPKLDKLPPAKDGRRRYKCEWSQSGPPAAVVLTPFADAGNAEPGLVTADVQFRTVFPVSPARTANDGL
jgi:hypothetical protein